MPSKENKNGQNWVPQGLIFPPDALPKWATSHAAVPTLEKRDGSLLSFLFSGRDQLGRSQVGRFWLDFSATPTLARVEQTRLLTPGARGTFDDDGVMASSVIEIGGQALLYYIGWNRGVTVPFRNSIGLARRDNSGSFVRVFDGPIIDRSALEPHFVASSFVTAAKGGYHMWYLSCTEWRESSEGIQHRYHIKYAASPDGFVWNRNQDIAIDYSGENEYAISRPWVVRDGDTWKMWYSYRGHRYRIGYAESEDARSWTRMDSQVSLPQGAGWDSDMVEYPCVFDFAGERWMLYNGNGYGKSGIGLAKLSTR